MTQLDSVIISISFIHRPKSVPFDVTSVQRRTYADICCRPINGLFISPMRIKSSRVTFVVNGMHRYYVVGQTKQKKTEFINVRRYIILPFLTAHIKKVHQNGDSRICDICAKFFKCSKSYEMHYISMHTDIQQKVQCEQCGKWLKHAGTLKEHMRRHVAKNAPCQLCGHISSNIKALRAHMRSAHRDPSFPCTICNKMFKKTQTLKVSTAVLALFFL